MAVLIRKVRTEDYPALFALDQACFAPGISWSRAELQYFLKYPGNIALAAEDDQSTLAGFAIGGMHRRRGKVLGRLITIDVNPSVRRRGIGQALLSEIQDRLLHAGAAALLLEVAVDNLVAQRFYEKHGFVRTGRIPGYYLGRIDALVMEKQL